ncbi:MULTISPECIES: hypothetical protein [Paenibacillus]|uniref:hypothetical protein n=1 Tax=Paenibacillus TaxID=44249 RepID=UPI002FDF504F
MFSRTRAVPAGGPDIEVEVPTRRNNEPNPPDRKDPPPPKRHPEPEPDKKPEQHQEPEPKKDKDQGDGNKDGVEGTGEFTPYTDGMRKYIPEPAPGDGYQALLEKYYIEIRKVGLDDVVTVAKNTGLTEQEVINMKKHVFLDLHDR